MVVSVMLKWVNPMVRCMELTGNDAAGNVIADSSGKPLEQKDVYIGHVEPDVLGGWKNQFRYKGFDFSFLFDFKKADYFILKRLIKEQYG